MPSFRRALAALFLLLTLVSAQATEDVLSLTTTTTLGSSSSAEGYTFEGTDVALSSFTTSTNTYQVLSSADNEFVRRNATNANQSSVWYTSSGVGTNLSGIHAS